MVLVLVACQPLSTPQQLDQRITYMLTGEGSWPDIKINYYPVEGARLCYEVTHDGEVWYGIASLVKGEWYVTIPSVERATGGCPVFEEV